MTKHSRILLACATLLSLAGCAQQNPQMPELKTEVGQLNQKLQRLTDLAVALEQQTTLNRQSTNGVYLLPAAKSAALVKSNIGQLEVQLTRVAPDAIGVQAVLEIKNTSGQPLPPFTASLSWGQLDPVTGKPLTVDMQTQTITVEPDLLPGPVKTVEVKFNQVTVDTLGFVHMHNIVAITPAPPVVATATSPVVAK
jgi:outer membrane murein-binding lipoprotein Lpp